MSPMTVQKPFASEPSPFPITEMNFRRFTPSHTTSEVMPLDICRYLKTAPLFFSIYAYAALKSFTTEFYLLFLCLSFNTTQVPLARHTIIGSSKTSQAESLMSGRGIITFLASNTIFLDVFPADTISPVASM